jgi:hypothetical protein
MAESTNLTKTNPLSGDLTPRGYGVNLDQRFRHFPGTAFQLQSDLYDCVAVSPQEFQSAPFDRSAYVHWTPARTLLPYDVRIQIPFPFFARDRAKLFDQQILSLWREVEFEIKRSPFRLCKPAVPFAHFREK